MVIEYVSLPGEVAPPVPDGPRLCDAGEMRILHNAFLWAYDQVPELMRSVAPGDSARAELVGGWLADIDATLHVHHEGEDELLWDRLAQRAPACALHVEQMRMHHAQVSELLDEVGPALARWRTTADPVLGEQLIDGYGRMLDVLKVHLRREVVEIIPVAQKVVTEKEWQALGEHSTSAIPKKRLLPQLGLLVANSPMEDRRAFWAIMAPPVKVMWRLFGKRQYERQFRQLFPDRPVPETI